MKQNPLLMNLLARDALNEEERTIALDLARQTVDYPADSEIVREGDAPASSTLMLSGLSARSNVLRGGSRQLTAIHVPGDFIDLHSLLMPRMDHSVIALTDCQVAKVSHERLRRLSEEQPHLTRLLWLLTVVDAAIYRRWLIAAGRLPSPAQIAHFLCEMEVRLATVGLAIDGQFDLPLSQSELSDAMGLSVVHVNRSIQQLRAANLIGWQGAHVTLLDRRRLAELAQFNPDYLSLGVSSR